MKLREEYDLFCMKTQHGLIRGEMKMETEKAESSRLRCLAF